MRVGWINKMVQHVVSNSCHVFRRGIPEFLTLLAFLLQPLDEPDHLRHQYVAWEDLPHLSIHPHERRHRKAYRCLPCFEYLLLPEKLLRVLSVVLRQLMASWTKIHWKPTKASDQEQAKRLDGLAAFSETQIHLENTESGFVCVCVRVYCSAV